LTRSTEARYHAPVPTVVMRPVLWEVADIVEQTFRIAYTESLHPRPEEYDAADCDYAAERGLSDRNGRADAPVRHPERDSRARQVVALIRLYGARRRPLDPEAH
jgi:hypothetical protein